MSFLRCPIYEKKYKGGKLRVKLNVLLPTCAVYRILRVMRESKATVPAPYTQAPAYRNSAAVIVDCLTAACLTRLRGRSKILSFSASQLLNFSTSQLRAFSAHPPYIRPHIRDVQHTFRTTCTKGVPSSVRFFIFSLKGVFYENKQQRKSGCL